MAYIMCGSCGTMVMASVDIKCPNCGFFVDPGPKQKRKIKKEKYG